MAIKKPPHKAKPSKKGRKYLRNYLGRDKRNSTKYEARMKRQGTWKVRKSHSKHA